MAALLITARRFRPVAPRRQTSICRRKAAPAEPLHAPGVGAAIMDPPRPNREELRLYGRLREARLRIVRLLGPIQARRGEVIVICYACETHYPVSIRAI